MNVTKSRPKELQRLKYQLNLGKWRRHMFLSWQNSFGSRNNGILYTGTIIQHANIVSCKYEGACGWHRPGLSHVCQKTGGNVMIRTSHYTHTTKRHVKETFVNSDRLPLTCNCPDAKSVMQTAKCVFYRLSASGPINILNLPILERQNDLWIVGNFSDTVFSVWEGKQMNLEQSFSVLSPQGSLPHF